MFVFALLQYWEKIEKKVYKLKVEIIDRLGLLADILNILARNKVNVETINQKMVKDRLVITFELLPKGTDTDMAHVIKEIKLVKNVLSALQYALQKILKFPPLWTEKVIIMLRLLILINAQVVECAFKCALIYV